MGRLSGMAQSETVFPVRFNQAFSLFDEFFDLLAFY